MQLLLYIAAFPWYNFEKECDSMPLLKTEISTMDDIYALPDGQRAELIDGTIYNMSPPNRLHQRIVFFLARKIQFSGAIYWEGICYK